MPLESVHKYFGGEGSDKLKREGGAIKIGQKKGNKKCCVKGV